MAAADPVFAPRPGREWAAAQVGRLIDCYTAVIRAYPEGQVPAEGSPELARLRYAREAVSKMAQAYEVEEVSPSYGGPGVSSTQTWEALLSFGSSLQQVAGVVELVWVTPSFPVTPREGYQPEWIQQMQDAGVMVTSMAVSTALPSNFDRTRPHPGPAGTVGSGSVKVVENALRLLPALIESIQVGEKLTV